MLTAFEKKTLKKYLTMAPEPEIAFTYDELLGYMFGLAMTPDVVLPSEWVPTILGGEMPEYESMKQAEEIHGCLMQVYNKFTAAFHDKQLKFPFEIEKLEGKAIETLYEWVSGFEEALVLRDELWDPEEYPNLADRKKEELYHSMMTIQGLVDPTEVMDFFEHLPDDVFQEAFPGMDLESGDREVQIQVFLMATLPLSVETLQDHARTVEKKRRQKLSTVPPRGPVRSMKNSRNEPCACSSGKKDKKCCGSDNATQLTLFDAAPIKKSNVIKVDFPQHNKTQPSQTPTYQLKVGLQGAKPPIWRRIQVPGRTTLEELHDIIQLCMGWDNYHLHQFIIDRTCYCLPDEDDAFRTSRPKNEAKYTLHDLNDKIQPRFQYIYDYGDDWLHQIEVEKTLPEGEGNPFPKLLTGRRACPPEDSGGIHGYTHMLEVLSDPEEDEYEDLMEWLGEEFDPADFAKEDIEIINVVLEETFSGRK